MLDDGFTLFPRDTLKSRGNLLLGGIGLDFPDAVDDDADILVETMVSDDLDIYYKGTKKI